MPPHKCKTCGGSSICQHGRRRCTCRACGGASICRHGKRRVMCRECGGSGLCEHNKSRWQCRVCGDANKPGGRPRLCDPPTATRTGTSASAPNDTSFSTPALQSSPSTPATQRRATCCRQNSHPASPSPPELQSLQILCLECTGSAPASTLESTTGLGLPSHPLKHGPSPSPQELKKSSTLQCSACQLYKYNPEEYYIIVP